MVATHISSGNGINTLMVFMTDSDANLRLNSLRLLSVLSVRIGKDIAFALRITLQLKHLKELLLTSGMGTLEVRIAAATILANIPLTEFEAKVLTCPFEILVVSYLLAYFLYLSLSRIGADS